MDKKVTSYLLMLFICCIPTVLYQILFMNSFFPITEGWFSEYGYLIRQGMMPYTDFSLLLPPLYPLQIAAFQFFFGEGIVALHYLGIVATCLIGMALFDILRHLFNGWIAAVSAAMTLIYYQSGNAFIGYDFTQFMTLYLILAGAALAHYAKGCFLQNIAHPFFYCFCIGLFFGLAFLIKQSNASVAIFLLGLTAVSIILRLNSLRTALLHFLFISCGFVIPISAVLIWLTLSGNISDFFNSILNDALASKGNLNTILFKWVHDVFLSSSYLLGLKNLLRNLFYLIALTMAFSIFVVFFMAILRRKNILLDTKLTALYSNTKKHQAMIMLGSLFVLLLFCLIILLIYNNALPFIVQAQKIGSLVHNQVYLWSINLYLIGFFIAYVSFLLRPILISAQYLVIFGLGIALLFGNGTSAGLSEISIFLGVALFLVFFLQLSLRRVVIALIPLVVFFSFSAFLIEQKFSSPYHWWTITSGDVRRVKCAKNVQGLLAGLCIHEDEYNKILQIQNHILANSLPTDSIYIFPHMPIFYLLTHRLPFAGAVVSWFDFMSDRQALLVAKKLLINPPPVIVVAELPKMVFLQHERLFRDYKKLGQHQILNAINQLKKEHIIQLIDTIYDVNGLPVSIYALNNPH